VISWYKKCEFLFSLCRYSMACQGLHGMKMGEKTLTVRRATQQGQAKPAAGAPVGGGAFGGMGGAVLAPGMGGLAPGMVGALVHVDSP
jgi:splicing factor U2AF subunit